MRDEALAIAGEKMDPVRKLNSLREYIQALALRSLHESEAFRCIAFIGGTALRFLYGLPRFSEDLDFSLYASGDYAPRKWMKKIKNDLTLGGFDVTVTWNERSTVHKCWIKIAQLMYAAGIASMRAQNLSIKIEIDTRPPEGAGVERALINRHRLFAVRHYDRPSLFAGKLHALLVRPYPKGRDWYDLVWYAAQRPAIEPNILLLQNALDQTNPRDALRASEWKSLLRSRLHSLDSRTLVGDVAVFLERPEEADLLEKEHILTVL